MKKAGSLEDEIVAKMIFSIAGLFAMGLNGESDEKVFAKEALSKSTLRIFFHLEQLSVQEAREVTSDPVNTLLLNVQDVTTKLRQKLKLLDPELLVLDKRTSGEKVDWSVA